MQWNSVFHEVKNHYKVLMIKRTSLREWLMTFIHTFDTAKTTNSSVVFKKAQHVGKNKRLTLKFATDSIWITVRLNEANVSGRKKSDSEFFLLATTADFYTK